MELDHKSQTRDEYLHEECKALSIVSLSTDRKSKGYIFFINNMTNDCTI